MWAVEAKTFGENAEYFYTSGLTERQSRILHSDLANSGEWAMVYSWNVEAKLKQQEADERIRNWKK